MQFSLFHIHTINWNEVRSHYAKVDEMKEAAKSEYYKRRNAGLKARNTYLTNQLMKKGK